MSEEQQQAQEQANATGQPVSVPGALVTPDPQAPESEPEESEELEESDEPEESDQEEESEEASEEEGEPAP